MTSQPQKIRNDQFDSLRRALRRASLATHPNTARLYDKANLFYRLQMET